MNPVVLIVGIGALFVLFKGSSAPKTALTPLQAAQLAAAQQAAAVQKQQNSTIGQLLAGLLGGNKQQSNPQAAPKSSGGGGGGLSNQSGGSGASKPAGAALGEPNAQCPMAAADTNTTTGTTSGLGAGVVEHGDGTVTVNGQVFCEATGQPIADGPPCIASLGPAIANCSCDVGQQNFNICGGTGAPAGSVSTFCAGGATFCCSGC